MESVYTISFEDCAERLETLALKCVGLAAGASTERALEPFGSGSAEIDIDRAGRLAR